MILLLLELIQFSSQAELPNNLHQISQNRLIKNAVNKKNEAFNDSTEQIMPDGNSNEISGCTFSNIVNSGVNNLIVIRGSTLFYNNVFQSDKYLSDQPGVIWLNNNNNFSLVNCSFIRHNTRSTNDAIILTVNNENTPHVTFESCKFIDCSNTPSKSLVIFNNGAPSVNFTDCLFTFSNQTEACKVLSVMNPNTIFDRCNFSGCGPEAITITPSATSNGQFQFTKNHVKTVKHNFITMTRSSATIEMDDNTFTDVTVENEHFIHISHEQKSINLRRNTFSHFTTSGETELNCGGIATFFQNPSSANVSLVYDHCTFIDIKNERSRGTSSYGGAIQFGFGNYLSSLILTISNCVFKENKAYKHGGALAIQTDQIVVIRNCTFENNVAVASSYSSSSILLDEKAEGRGGAIFLNPVFTFNSNDKQMQAATIENCKFLLNVAFGGYAIYIDGKSDKTVFTITSNKFFNNYAGNDAEQCTHGAIDSESISIDVTKIKSENDFSVIEHGYGSKIIVFVDNLGFILPDPTATPRATQPPTPQPVDGTSPNYIDKYFEGQNYTSQIQLGQSDIKQISGCTFKNILKPNNNNEMNNFIHVTGDSQTYFFNNIVEYDEVQRDQPAVIWLDNNVAFTISHCKFVRVTHREGSGDACILVVDGDNNPAVTFESCEFIDCAYATDESLVKLKNKDPTINFTDCTISFSQTGCQIIQAMNPHVVFERCQITGCASKAINLESIPDDGSLTGQFVFNNNVVKKQTNNFIFINNLKSVPEINNNLFEDVTVSEGSLFYVSNNQYNLKLAFNTFSRITSTSDSYGGGLSCFAPSTAISSATKTLKITYDNCNFYDIKNLKSTKPYYQGGAVQCGFNKDFCNLDFIVTNCVFKGNQAFKHGGALAAQIQGSLTIRNTTFEENRANMKAQTNSRNLLDFDDFTELKEEGRGGAIYLNPTFTVEGDSEKNMVNVIIDNCTFKRNVAFDGFAIYFEGQNGANTQYQITNNFFIDNYNGKDSSSSGGVFVTEITDIKDSEIITTNSFSNKENGVDATDFVYVDHSGIRLPDSTMTPLPTNQDGSNSEIWNQTDYDIKTRVEVEKNQEQPSDKNVVLKVEATIFEEMHEINGSAIHLVNCGLECTNKCEFINLGKEESIGGAIYIYNQNEMLNSVSLDGLFFKSCKADCGGAIFIHSSSLKNEVSIKKCQFEGNSVSEKGPSEELTGGSAIYLSVKRGVILYCIFRSNIGPGGSVRLNENFQDEDQNTASILAQFDPKVEIKNCFFAASDSSIFYVAGKSCSQIEVNNCIFANKIEKNGHHIDGLLIDKSAPKLIVKSCKLVDESIEKVVDRNSKFATVDEKSLVLGFNEVDGKKKASGSLWMLISCLMIASALVVVVVILVLKKLKKSQNSIQNDDELINDESIVSEATI